MGYTAVGNLILEASWVMGLFSVNQVCRAYGSHRAYTEERQIDYVVL